MPIGPNLALAAPDCVPVNMVDCPQEEALLNELERTFIGIVRTSNFGLVDEETFTGENISEIAVTVGGLALAAKATDSVIDRTPAFLDAARNLQKMRPFKTELKKLLKISADEA